MKLVHLANLAGGAFFIFVGFMGAAHGVDLTTALGGGFLTVVGGLYICGAVSCLFKRGAQ